jgi:hypothetical protein
LHDSIHLLLFQNTSPPSLLKHWFCILSAKRCLYKGTEKFFFLPNKNSMITKY